MSTSDGHDPTDEAPADPELDRADILRRRKTFIARAVGGVSVSAFVVACDALACLKMAASGDASSASASAAPSSSSSVASPSTPPVVSASSAPPDGRSFSISPAEARKLGLPALGFRVEMTKGWSKSGASKDQYVRASGPPGGPLVFLAKPFEQASEKAAIEELFRNVFSDRGGVDSMEIGPGESVTLGGRRLEAQAFRTGKSMTTTNWCVVKAPGGAAAPGGILFMFGTATAEGAKPSCKRSLDHDWIAEIVSTLAFLE